MFLIVKESGKQIKLSNGKYVTDEEYQIPLVAGWNLIGNPYNWDIDTSKITLESNRNIKFWTFEGKWDTVTVLNPWKGYAISVLDADVLTFRPFSEPEILTTSQVNGFLSPDNNWQIEITAQCESAQDDKNYAGVRINSKNNWDKNDFFEPPPFGEYVMVNFPHPEWGNYLIKYTTDYKAPDESGYLWDFEVVSNLTDKITLTFLNIEKVPPLMSGCKMTC